MSCVCVAVTSGMYVVRALRMRKGLGGGWRKPGPLAAAALVAMEDAAERFQKDHEHAKRFAKGYTTHTIRCYCESVYAAYCAVKLTSSQLVNPMEPYR